MAGNEAIKNFVRVTLGCGCPDEVFDHIEVDTTACIGSIAIRRVTIGHRLLVCLFEMDDLPVVEAALPQIVAAGRDERDRRGLNRFRAVVVSDDVGSVAPLAERLFRSLSAVDEKVHLHVLSRDAAAEVMSAVDML